MMRGLFFWIVLGLTLVTLVGCGAPQSNEAGTANAPNPANLAVWTRARRVEISNPTDQPLRDYQVRITLDASNFDFEQAAPNGADLRFTELSGTLPLNYWVEQFDPTARQAVVWVKVPEVPALATKTLTLHTGYTSNTGVSAGVSAGGSAGVLNLSSGRRTFEMFDDFGKPGLGYYQFGPPTTVMTKSAPWETQSPHTLSVVEMDPAQNNGFKYTGYYGLADCGGIGLARSNDLLSWQRAPTPLLNQDGERWPAVLKIDNTFYMAYDRNHCDISQVVLRTSTDGVNFGGPRDYTVLVAREPKVRNQNPALFRDPKTGLFYLYWFRGGADFGVWQIKMRSARTVEGLADASAEKVLFEVPFELAAPNMMFYDDTYFLSTEVNENAWKTTIYASASPAGPFELLPDNPVLSDNQACLFQHVINDPKRGDVMQGYFCKVMGADWVLNQREALLANGRSSQRQIDTGVWAPISGTWQLIEDPASAGNIVLRGTGILKTALSGQDYGFGVNARPSENTAWGVAVRMQDESNYLAAIVEAGEVRLVKVLSGTARIIATAPVTDTAATWRRLHISAAGSRVIVGLDDTNVIDAQVEGPVTSGSSAILSTALRAGAGGAGAGGAGAGQGASTGDIVFDDVRWRKSSTAEMAGTVAIQFGPAQKSEWRMPTLPAITTVQDELGAESTSPPANAQMAWVAVVGLIGAVMTIIAVAVVVPRRPR